MNTQHRPASLDSAIDSIERVLESMETSEVDWRRLDSTFLDGASADPGRVARFTRALRGRRDNGHAGGWVAEIRATSTRPNEPGGSQMRSCGRHYSCALLALVDALAAEPSTSPLAASLDDLRADAFLVAGQTAAVVADLPLIHHLMLRADRRLIDLPLPLRATGYLRARDELRTVIDRSLPAEPRAGGP